MRTVAIIQARMGSSRLPGKVLRDLAGRPLLWHVVDRCRGARELDWIGVATTEKSDDESVVAFCKDCEIPCHRGPSDDVLARYYGAAREWKADAVVRITGDCPLIDSSTIDSCVRKFREGSYDYLSNTNPGPRTFPRGLDVEVFSYAALERAARTAREPYEREHVTPFLWENKTGWFRVASTVTAPDVLARPYRLTVDYPEDFLLIETLYGVLYTPPRPIPVRDALFHLDNHPELVRINRYREQKPIHPTAAQDSR